MENLMIFFMMLKSLKELREKSYTKFIKLQLTWRKNWPRVRADAQSALWDHLASIPLKNSNRLFTMISYSKTRFLKKTNKSIIIQMLQTSTALAWASLWIFRSSSSLALKTILNGLPQMISSQRLTAKM